MNSPVKYKIVAVLDTIEDRIIPQSLELVSFIKHIYEGELSDLLLVITGRCVSGECGSIAEKYGIDIAVFEHDEFYYPNPDLLIKVLREVVRQYNPETICLSHTIRNCSAASGVSSALKIRCITGVESVTKEPGGAVYQRSIFNGKLRERVKFSCSQSILTVISGAFQLKNDEDNPERDARIFKLSIESLIQKYKPQKVSKDIDLESSIEDADVIIAAGRGISKPDNIELVRNTAKIFNNAAVGASRPVCDNKWLPYRHQVGVTGKTVSPKLYMALGISGSQQHIAGMKNSQCIVAVNTDPHAAIFSIADYIIVEDINKFIPVLISRYHERSGGGSG